MSNFLYNKAKDRFLAWQTSGDPIDIIDDDIKVCLVDSAYGVDPNDEYFDVIQSSVVGAPVLLTNKTLNEGVFNADDVTFASVSGPTVTQLVLYKDTTDPLSSPLIAYIDVVASGLPVIPNGGNITVQWAASGIFTL